MAYLQKNLLTLLSSTSFATGLIVVGAVVMLVSCWVVNWTCVGCCKDTGKAETTRNYMMNSLSKIIFAIF